MPTRLIINADDFGLTPGINRAIAELHTAGVLTSATLMAHGPAFGEAVAIAHRLPTLGVGCHIVLTDGTPVSDPSTIPSLLGPDRRTFRPTLTSFLAALLTRRIRADDIEREAFAQIQKLQQAGIHPTHIDTHKHTHTFRAVAEPILRAATRAGVHSIRLPFEPRWSIAANRHATPSLRRLQVQLLSRFEPRLRVILQASGATTTDGTLGIAATGSLTERTLTAILLALPPTGTWELCCHPGYNDPDLAQIPTRLRTHRNTEREALLAALPAVLSRPSAPTLISYAALWEAPPAAKLG